MTFTEIWLGVRGGDMTLLFLGFQWYDIFPLLLLTLILAVIVRFLRGVGKGLRGEE